MGISSNGSSLLVKLGLKPAHLMVPQELESLVADAQKYRSIQRALGRIKKMETLKADGRRRSVKKQVTLESLGFAPAIISALRAKGIADAKIILQMQQKGLL